MKILEGQPGKAINELDKTLAFLGLVFSTILTIWLMMTIGRFIYVSVGILSFLACTGYLLLRRKLSLSTITSLAQTRASPRFYLVLNILFSILLSYGIASIYLSPELYTRPMGYFISIALMAAIVGVEILLLSPHKSHTYSILFKIIIIGLSLQWSQQLIFSNVVGIDPWLHQMFTLKMLDAGHIPEGNWYSKMPVFHLITGVTSLITALNYKMATMLSIGLLQVVCDTLFVFLLGRFILNDKVGLLAALLLMVANQHLLFGFWAIPNTLAITLILPIIYLMFKIRKEKPILAISLYLLFMAILILTHTVAAVSLAILLVVFWAGFKIYTRLYRSKLATLESPLVIGILFAIAMLGYWMYSGHIVLLGNLIKLGFKRDLWGVVPLEAVVRYMRDVPFSDQLFNNLGWFLFFTLSFIGCFYMLSKILGNSYSFVMVMGGLVILALGFLTPLFGLDIIVGRWLYLAQNLLAIPLSLALLLLCGVLRDKLARVGLMSFLVFPLSFLMIMSPTANLDNHLFSPNTGVCYAFTESELQAMDTISNVWDGKIGADRHYQLPIINHFNGNFITIDDYLLTRDFTNGQDMLVMIRQEIVNFPFPLSSGIFKLNYDPRHVLAEQGFSRIYGNGSVNGFLKLQ
ncbi:hypothetical protein ACFLVO_04390 [Chloroflexota bacterium]